MTLEEKIEKIIGDNNNKLLDAVNGVFSSPSAGLIDETKQELLKLIKDLIQECKPKPEVECVCGEYGVEDCDNVWHMRACGIDGYERNILKALEESTTLEKKIIELVGDIQSAVFYAEEDNKILKNQRKYFTNKILFELEKK